MQAEVAINDVRIISPVNLRFPSRWGKLKYRLYRNPFILFVIIPVVLFVVLYRLPISDSKDFKKFQPSVYITSIVIALIVLGLIWLIGWQNFLMIQLPITFIASTTGTWLFYVQHQFEDTYWSESKGWDYTSAALHGSCYYKLPKFYNGLQVILVFIIYIILVRKSQTTFLKNVIKRIQFFKRLLR